MSGYCSGNVCTDQGKSWTGGGCTTDADCESNVCVGGTCKPGPLSQPCRTAADCQNTISCAADQTCGGAGASCQNDNTCVSGSCLPAGVCA